MRILVLNNYSFTRVLNEVECKLKPAHHLYGLNIIKERGHELIILEKNTSSFIYKLFNFLAKIPLCNFGDVELQIRAILKSNQYDLIYAPCQDCTPLLGILSYFKFFNKPIIAIAHHPFLVGRLTFFKKIGLYFSLNGHFAYPALSAVIANQINSVVKKDLSFELFWGPDIQYYNSLVEKKPTVENKFDIVSIGRTGRDYNTLISAFVNTSVRVGIFCNKSLKEVIQKNITDNILIHWLNSDEELDYEKVVDIYRASNIIAVPMFEQNSLCGLTSVTDAIALCIPIIATKNKYLNIDVESEQIGIWAEPYNTKDWVLAHQNIQDSATDKINLSKNNWQAVQYKYNHEQFSNQIIDIINKIDK